MEVYLIRHGIAVERGTYAQDEERPLTDKGRHKTYLVAKKLLSLDLKFDLILTSPLVRAYQTAEILQQVGLSEKIEIFPSLAPDGSMQEWENWLLERFRPVDSNIKLALVGHQPDLGNWAEILVWGNKKEQIRVKKAGVIGLKIFNLNNPRGTSELFLLTAPKWLI